jgi:hypothetical protein
VEAPAVAEVADVAPEPVAAPARVAPKSRRRIAAVKIDTEVDAAWATVEAPAVEPVIDLTAEPDAEPAVQPVVEIPVEPVVETPAPPVATAAIAAANWARPNSVWRDRVFNAGYERRQNESVTWPPLRRQPAPTFIDLEAEAAVDSAAEHIGEAAPAE